MKSIRLNKQIRKDIISSINMAFNENALKKYSLPKNVSEYRQNELISAIMGVYNDKYKDTVLSNIPKEFLRFGKGWLEVHAEDGRVYQIKTPNNVATPDSRVLKVVSNPEFTKIFAEYELVAGKINEMNKDLISSIKETTVILDSVNTTQQLIDLWPKIEQYLPAYIQSPEKVINLPALRTDRLSEKLGL